jgi:hypothetical protein
MSNYPCDPSRKAKGSKGRCHAKLSRDWRSVSDGRAAESDCSLPWRIKALGFYRFQGVTFSKNQKLSLFYPTGFPSIAKFTYSFWK